MAFDRLTFLGALMVALTACGGGGSSGTPTAQIKPSSQNLELSETVSAVPVQN